ncbi:MAG: ATP phosphoribosyltransferase regulatory subunit [Aestuariivirgaceae bacterium]|nr:ATP phosphoribosyltransferase regulatory subunit [Aestuariivirgaceae bacterium]
MAGRTPQEREALNQTGTQVLAHFTAAGFQHIAPDILQPADVFLDRSGEEIRARSFVFTDPSGAELCLRPDLTVPACRYHLTHAARADQESRYCYWGPAFRFDPETNKADEFDQAGLEWFAAADAQESEAQVLALAVEAIEAAGVADFTIRIGDLGLFSSLLDSIAMPARWRRRLAHQFWRPKAFHELLLQLTGSKTRAPTAISPLIDALGDGDAESFVETVLARDGLPLVGGRSIAEIAGRLSEKAKDRTATPLSQAAAARMDAYLAIAGTPQSCAEKIAKLGLDVTVFNRRLDLLKQRGIAPSRLQFSAVFGRSLEYYTGLVFQIETADGTQLAGGGRYDRLLQDIGSPVPVPAVGLAVHTEKLTAARKA